MTFDRLDASIKRFILGTNIYHFDSFIEKLEKLRAESAKKSHEVQANHYWRLRETFTLYKIYIEAFYNLQLKFYREAWNLLEECEIKCKSLTTNSSDDYLKYSNVSLIQILTEQLQSLYPYCLFISPEYKIKRILCSICGSVIKPRKRCAHKVGYLYNGEICFHIISDFEFLSFSLVSNPVQKYSVLHDDSQLNFVHIDHLMNRLSYPFEFWNFERKTMSYPRHMFNSLNEQDLCPCHSKLNFNECCIGKSEIAIPHIDFIFDKYIPPEQCEPLFPY